MRKNTIIIAALALVGLASCEMREEIKGDNASSDTGVLELSVQAKAPASARTKAGEETDADVSTTGFNVQLYGTDDANKTVTRDYVVGTDLPEAITLPVGNYNITAHTPGNLEKKMSYPYYGGEQALNIVKDLTSSKTVTCKRKNSRMAVVYNSEFLTTFETWTITIDGGTETALSLTEKDGLNPAPIYWLFGEGVETVTVNFTATLKTGESVQSSSQTYTKKDANESYKDDTDFFTGGDALIFNLGVAKSPSGKITGFDLKVEITFEEDLDPVEIPVGDKPAEPVNPEDPKDPVEPEPGDGPIVISEPNGTNYLETGVNITSDQAELPDDIALLMTFKNGLQHLYVLASSSDPVFEGLLGQLQLTEGEGLDLAGLPEDEKAEFSNLFPLPDPEKDSYTFELSPMLLGMLQGFPGEHAFQVTVVDSKDNKVTKTLTVNVTEKGGN